MGDGMCREADDSSARAKTTPSDFCRLWLFFWVDSSEDIVVIER